MSKHRILAVDPGTREIGVAVLDGDELIYYAVKTIRERGTAQKVLRQAVAVVVDLIGAYEPDCLAIEKMFVVQKSAALLSVLAEEIKSAARGTGLDVYEYAPTTIRKFICQTGKATKSDVAKIVAGRYPELARHLKAITRWEEKYYANMFDAVAVGLMCRQEVSGKAAAA
ncbi:MAG: crossover junction endodeoxyribonuclease RuvC [bacterium]